MGEGENMTCSNCGYNVSYSDGYGYINGYVLDEFAHCRRPNQIKNSLKRYLDKDPKSLNSMYALEIVYGGLWGQEKKKVQDLIENHHSSMALSVAGALYCSPDGDQKIYEFFFYVLKTDLGYYVPQHLSYKGRKPLKIINRLWGSTVRRMWGRPGENIFSLKPISSEKYFKDFLTFNPITFSEKYVKDHPLENQKLPIVFPELIEMSDVICPKCGKKFGNNYKSNFILFD